MQTSQQNLYHYIAEKWQKQATIHEMYVFFSKSDLYFVYQIELSLLNNFLHIIFFIKDLDRQLLVWVVMQRPEIMISTCYKRLMFGSY